MIIETCDMCKVAKALWVAVLEKDDSEDLKLFFCNHHHNIHYQMLKKQNFISVKLPKWAQMSSFVTMLVTNVTKKV